MQFYKPILWFSSLFLAIKETSSINFDLYIFNWGSICFRNDTYWKVVDKFFDPLDFIDVKFIATSNSTIQNHPVFSLFLKNLSESELHTKNTVFNRILSPISTIFRVGMQSVVRSNRFKFWTKDCKVFSPVFLGWQNVSKKTESKWHFEISPKTKQLRNYTFQTQEIKECGAFKSWDLCNCGQNFDNWSISCWFTAKPIHISPPFVYDQYHICWRTRLWWSHQKIARKTLGGIRHRKRGNYNAVWQKPWGWIWRRSDRFHLNFFYDYNFSLIFCTHFDWRWQAAIFSFFYWCSSNLKWCGPNRGSTKKKNIVCLPSLIQSNQIDEYFSDYSNIYSLPACDQWKCDNMGSTQIL